MNRFVIALTLAAISVAAAPAPQNPAPAAQKKTTQVNDKFSGTVTELDSDSLTVVRTVLARDAVTRKFLLDPQTKVEGNLKVKSRVTVQYQSTDDGQFRAIHIIVR